MCDLKIEESITVYPGITRHRELRRLQRLDGSLTLVTGSTNPDGSLGNVDPTVELYQLTGQIDDDLKAAAWEQIMAAFDRPILHERDASLPCTCVTVEATEPRHLAA